MFTKCRPVLVLAASALLAPSLSHAQAPKPPIKGLISMGAYRCVGAGGAPDNTLEAVEKKRGIFSGIGAFVGLWLAIRMS